MFALMYNVNIKTRGCSMKKYDSLKAIMIRNVPESLRRELKAKAASEGKSIQRVLVQLIEKYVGKGEVPVVMAAREYIDVREYRGDVTRERHRAIREGAFNKLVATLKTAK